jgi:hypothetical protein
MNNLEIVWKLCTVAVEAKGCTFCSSFPTCNAIYLCTAEF